MVAYRWNGSSGEQRFPLVEAGRKSVDYDISREADELVVVNFRGRFAPGHITNYIEQIGECPQGSIILCDMREVDLEVPSSEIIIAARRYTMAIRGRPKFAVLVTPDQFPIMRMSRRFWKRPGTRRMWPEIGKRPWSGSVPNL